MAAGAPDPFIPMIQALAPISGRYTNLQWIGGAGMEGFFSLLFSGTDSTTGGQIAIKFFHPRFGADAYRRACFTREAILLAEFGGEDNILQLVDGEHTITVPMVGPGGILIHIPLSYYVTELAGGSLRDYIYSQANNPMDSLILFREACKALQRIHTRGITHRDLKPSNLLLFPGKVAKLCDFGAARRIGGTAIGPQDMYAGPVGDTAYSALEMFCGLGSQPEMFAVADLFSLGAILYELFTRQILTDLVFDQQMLRGLITVFSRIPEGHRQATLDSMLPGFAGRLPDFAPNALIPASIRPRLTALYKGLAEIDHRKRSAISYDWIFGQINVCLRILEIEEQRNRRLAIGRAWRQNRAAKGTGVRAVNPGGQ